MALAPAAVLALLTVITLTGGAFAHTVDKVDLQLKWVTQAQFAGYYAARDRGFYAAERLDVSIRPGSPELVPEQVVADGRAQFGVGWVSSLLAARDRGKALVNVAQVFAYSGMREVAFKSSGIKGPADLKGRRVAVWFAGNEYPLVALLDKVGIDRQKDVTLVHQPFDMGLLLERAVDAAAVTTYNELKQLMDAGVKPDDLTIIDFHAHGTAMLEDGIFVSADWLARPGNKERAVRFVRASLKGWEFCRDRPAACVDLVLKAQPILGREHQTWMMTEVNKLIWGPPKPPGPLGRMNPAAFRQTADIAFRYEVIKKPADPAAYTDEIWRLAQAPKRQPQHKH